MEAAGLDPKLVDKYLGDPPDDESAPPDTASEMARLFLHQIWKERARLKGTALVQVFGALVRLAEAERPVDEEQEEEVDVLELIDTPGLLPERRRELLVQERDRVRARLTVVEEKLKEGT